MTDPRKFYDKIISEIEDQDIRKVAIILYAHIGKGNRIDFKDLVTQVFGKYSAATERKTRLIITDLVVKYRYPVCALSDTPGRWLAANKDEAIESAHEIEARIQELSYRASALRMVDLPVVPLEERAHQSQISLF